MKQVLSDRGVGSKQSTREQLEAAQHRADFFTLLGMLIIAALFWRSLQSGDDGSPWGMTSIALAVIVIGLPLWYVTRRKREISATRLVCPHCGYVPHDTEISEVAETLQCQRCERPLR